MTLAVIASDLDSFGTVLAGYALTAVGVGAYIARMLTRNRALSRQVPDEDKPWL